MYVRGLISNDTRTLALLLPIIKYVAIPGRAIFAAPWREGFNGGGPLTM